MIDMYCVLIVAGKKAISDVPTRYQAAVTEQLSFMGLDANGNVLV